ncbi:MAG: hypothetical protein GX495_06100 [Chloroflexi bacterium]|nr:hypothetical protein [Chloroflexota bacterium]
MKKALFSLSCLLGLMLLVSAACSFNVSTANIREATMARDSEGAEPTTVFAPGDTFYLIVDLANAPDSTTVRADWTAVDVEGTEPNLFIDGTELTSSDAILTFNLTNDGLWPSGTYKVDLYLNDKLERTIEFQVQE